MNVPSPNFYTRGMSKRAKFGIDFRSRWPLKRPTTGIYRLRAIHDFSEACVRP